MNHDCELLMEIRERFSNSEIIKNKFFSSPFSQPNKHDKSSIDMDHKNMIDNSFKKALHICSSDERRKEGYVSEGSMVEIVVPKKAPSINVLVHFKSEIIFQCFLQNVYVNYLVNYVVNNS